MNYCIEAKVYGIINFEMGVTLREGNREYFYAALDKHFPGMREKYHKRYGYAYEIPSDKNHELMELFHKKCKENGIVCDVDKCFQYLHELPEKYEQLRLIQVAEGFDCVVNSKEHYMLTSIAMILYS